MRCLHRHAPVPSTGRRVMLVALALALSILILHAPLSNAMVTRGDEMLYQGDSRRALTFYRRAMLLDGANAAAADRYVFVSMTLHTENALRSAVRVATEYLMGHPEDMVVRMDRALCEWRLRWATAAESDFESVAEERRDARAFVFAGYAARAAGDRSGALRLWRAALTIEPAYVPALRAFDTK